MPHVLSKVEAGNAKDKRVLAGLEKLDEDLEKLVVLVVELMRVLAPEALGPVHWRPLQTARMNLSHVLVVRTEGGGGERGNDVNEPDLCNSF